MEQVGIRIECDEPLALHRIRHGGDDADVRIAQQRLEPFLELHVRHHLACNLAEARQPVGDPDEPRVVDGRDVAGDIPAVPECLAGEIRFTEIAGHPVRTVHEQQPLLANQRPLACLRIHDHRGDTGQRAADRSTPRACVPGVGHVHRHDRRHLGAAIAFGQLDAELLLERRRDRLAQPLRADNRQAQMGELVRQALAHVGPAEGRRADQQRRSISRRELADGLRVGRVRMVGRAEADDERQPERDVNPKE